MSLLPIALLLVVVYLLIARKSRVSLFRRLLVPTLFSLFVTLHLGINYVVSLIPNPEGISLSSSYLHWIFGDTNWSIERFRSAFRISSWVSFAWLCATAVVAFGRSRS